MYGLLDLQPVSLDCFYIHMEEKTESYSQDISTVARYYLLMTTQFAA